MEKNKRSKRYSPEVRTRAVRMVLEHQQNYDSQWSAISAIAPKIGCTAETLRKWLRQEETDIGLRDGVTSDERERIKALEREVRELRQANEILRKASRVDLVTRTNGVLAVNFAQAERAMIVGAH